MSDKKFRIGEGVDEMIERFVYSSYLDDVATMNNILISRELPCLRECQARRQCLQQKRTSQTDREADTDTRQKTDQENRHQARTFGNKTNSQD